MKQALKTKFDTLEGLNEQQIKAVTFGNGPLLIIAGAGTGKTTVITRRIAWLIEQGLAKPEEILALTFTDKAATEMEERVDQLMPLGYAEINISTFHAFAYKILYQHALDIGLPGDFKVITDTQAWMLMRKHIHEFDLDYYRPIGNPNRFIHQLLKHFGKAKGEEIAPQDYIDYAQSLSLNNDNNLSTTLKDNDNQEVARVKEVANAYHKYQKLLLDNSFLDFGDLINYTLKLFRTRPKILALYQQQFKYILVDEFQDTDLSQYELVKLLALPENNLAVVGDDDQSIYKFRGASVSNILKFKEDYPKAAEVTLVDNFRSTQNILDLAYNFIQLNNPERLESKLKISKRLKSNKEGVGIVEVIHGRTVFEEARLVIEKILQLIDKRGLRYDDFAILVRANDSAEPFIAQLAKWGIPYIFVANRGLYKKPFILDLLAYLDLLDNYHESENLFRILNMKQFKIADEDLIAMSQIAKRKSVSLYEVVKSARVAVKLSADTHKKLDELLSFLEKHTQTSRSRPVTELMIKVLGDLQLLKQLSKDLEENVENRGLVEQFYRKALDFEQESDDKTLKPFMQQIKLELEAGNQGELAYNPQLGVEAVRVMTIHSAKGLEFACVFVVNLVEQRFPSRDRKEPIEIPKELIREILPQGDVHIMEERRLFYVAQTRAKEYLYLTWADDYGGVTHKKPSRFLVELRLEKPEQAPKPLGEVFFTNPSTNRSGLAPSPKRSINLSIPESFSYSQITCFERCPLEYKYRYLYHLPLPGEAYFSFGETIHKTLEKFLLKFIQLNAKTQPDLFGSKQSKLSTPPKEVLYKYYEETWIDDWFADKIQKDKYRKRGYEMLDIFYGRFLENPKPVKFLEQRFKLRLSDYKFTGKIDRADLNPDATIDIIDYKTGEVREKLMPEDKRQLLIYQWAAQQEFKQKVNSLRYWYLASLRDSVEFLGTQKEITGLQDQLLKTINVIIEAIKHNSFAELDSHKSHECKFRYLEG